MTARTDHTSGERRTRGTADADLAHIDHALTDAVRKAGAGNFHPRTDTGLGERLADQAEDEILWVHGMGWLVWDGKRWKRDESGAVMRIATRTVRTILSEAAALNADAAMCEDEEKRKVLAAQAGATTKFARQSESLRATTAMVKFGESQASLVLKGGAMELDTNEYALNVGNGTLDLKTLELRPHDPKDRNTKITNADYAPNATTDLWTGFIERILPDADVRRYVQKATGVSLLGRYSEFLFIPWGTGANGKSKFLGALRDALGDYAMDSPTDLLVKKHGAISAGESAAIAQLQGTRFVTSIETAQGKKLDEVFVKQVTGEGTIKAKLMRQNPFEFSNQVSMWLATNHMPTLDTVDEAMRRRVRKLPFTTFIPEDERDTELDVKLRAPDQRAAILSWMVEGLRAFLEEGHLDMPEAVASATNEWVDEMDPLKEWVDTYCTLDPDGAVSVAEVQASYSAYCSISQTRPLGRRELNEHLRSRGFVDKQARIGPESKSVRAWVGIARASTPTSPADLYAKWVEAGEPEPTEAQMAGYHAIAD